MKYKTNNDPLSDGFSRISDGFSRISKGLKPDGSYFSDLADGLFDAFNTPDVHWFKCDEGLYTTVEVAGFDKSNLEISSNGKQVSIKGKTALFGLNKEINEVINIPYKHDSIKAQVECGILKLILVKPQPKEYKVEFV